VHNVTAEKEKLEETIEDMGKTMDAIKRESQELKGKHDEMLQWYGSGQGERRQGWRRGGWFWRRSSTPSGRKGRS